MSAAPMSRYAKRAKLRLCHEKQLKKNPSTNWLTLNNNGNNSIYTMYAVHRPLHRDNWGLIL